MFKMFLAAPTMIELKAKLQEAADHINDPNTIQDEEDLGYATNPDHNESSLPEPNQPDRDDDPVPEETEEDVQSVEVGELDSRGLPWDARIHAATKAKTKDGAWRYRRGSDEKEIAKVEKELRSLLREESTEETVEAAPGNQGLLSQESVATTGVPSANLDAEVTKGALGRQSPAPLAQREFAQPPVIPPPPPPLATMVSAPVFTQPVAPPPAVYENIAVPVQAVKPAHTLETFKANIIPLLAQLVMSGAIDQNYLETLKNYFGVKEVWHVVGDETKAQEMYESFCSTGLITRVG